MLKPAGFKFADRGLTGQLQPPGDKSISHRAAIFALLSEQQSEISGFLRAEDTLATLAACEAMGALVEDDGETLLIRGVGISSLQQPASGRLDMGNSGTAMRLLAGVLAAQCFSCELFGDASLSGRPMGRIIKPLQQMGARIHAQNACPPLQIEATCALTPLEYHSPVASAQVKSCLLLAGLCAGVEVTVCEPALSRDHSERMLAALGAEIKTTADAATGEHCISLKPVAQLNALNMQIPADISSAAFAIVAALIVPDSDIRVRNISMNPTRARLLDVLLAMGGRIEVLNRSEQGGEAVADLRVQYSSLQGTDVPPAWVPGMIDEFPILMIAASQASGTTRVRGAAELRVKESDRIAVMTAGLKNLGIEVDEWDDGFDISGKPGVLFTPARLDAQGDHRIAMSFLIAGLRAKGPIRVSGIESIASSYPGFISDMHALGAQSLKTDIEVPVIAIDGPSGVGKGTTASLLAQKLGWHLLDSGALYRLLALAVIRRGISAPEQQVDKIAALAESLAIEFTPDANGQYRARLDGEDVSALIRNADVTEMASRIAAIPAARNGLFQRQRAFLQAPGLVADGRDMGTVVFTDAALKIFLTASAEERAKRRHKQLKAKGENVSISRLYKDIQERDSRDRSRKVAPLRPAKDSIVIDSTDLSIQEVLDKVLKLHKETFLTN